MVPLEQLVSEPRSIAYGVLKPGPYDSTGVPLIRIKDLKNLGIDQTELHYITAALDLEFKRTRLEGGEVLISIQGTIGRVAIVPKSLASSNISRTLAVIRPRDPNDTKWIMYGLTAPQSIAQFEKVVTGSTRDSLNLADLRQVRLPVAPPQTRDCIVAKIEEQFSRLDEAVANLKRVKANLKRYRAAVLKAAVEGKLTTGTNMVMPTPFSELIEGLSQGWSPKCELSRDPLPNEWAIIKTTAVQSMRYLDSESKPLPSKFAPRLNIEIKAGDFLMTRKGPRQRAGVACLVRKTRSRLMVCDTVYRFRCKESRVNPAYLELALNSPLIVSEIDRRKSGISDSGVSLTHDKIGSVLVPMPQLAEQERIVAEVERRLSVIEELEAVACANLTRAD